MTGPTYSLTPSATRGAAAPTLDAAQQRVVDHEGGPLLVLAGPGTGKTTTLVEAIVDRVENRGADPGAVLALTFSRKAAEQLRDRVTTRLGRTTSAAISSTFHSFAYGLVRAKSPAELYSDPLRLLSAPEQDVLVAELLTGPEAVRWPDGLRAAVGTRGFAREVASVLSRARERGVDPEDLVALGERADEPAYSAAGRFLSGYLDVLDATSSIDYGDLLRRAVALAGRYREELRERYRHVFVDEYQDTDPSQVALLRELAGDGGDLVVVGDPHQSIYGFRGADVRGILDFPAQFPQTSGERAETVVLGTTRRFGEHLLLASQRVAARLPLHGSVAEEGKAAFRSPVALGAATPGRAEVITFDTDRAETEHLADRLRRAHLEDGVDWSDMAVLVRSGRASIPALRRGLAAAGVPVEVASDDTPLVAEPAVQPLLAALRAVLDLDVTDTSRPDHLDAVRAHTLLVSPLCGLDATEVRSLGRALRGVARADGLPVQAALDDQVQAAATGTPVDSSPELLRRALVEPDLCADLPGAAAAKVRAFAALLAAARDRLDAGGTAEDVLWQLWSGTSWPRRLYDSAVGGGPGARLAHRDLDAICSLFDTAAHTEEQRGHTSVPVFLETLTAQQIPADTLADRGVRGSAVRLMTAHRSKGLEWRLVVVAHVQEEGWPDLRRRASLLRADRIGRDGLVPPATTRSMLEEERRLFYVACTRAREQLLVTAVRSADEDGEVPSRFLEELGVEVRHVAGRPARPLSLPGLVATLRRTTADPDASEALRDAAARRLAALAAVEVGGRPVAPGADHRRWWGVRPPSRADAPLRRADEPVTISPSALTTLEECPAKWFFEREAGGREGTTSAQGFGLVIHAIADRVGSGELTGDDATLDALMEQVDAVWSRLAFRTPWSASREREQARKALARFIEHHHREGARTVIATEKELEARVELPDGTVVRVRGFADRLELDEAGDVVVVDLKTGKSAPTGAEVAVHPQLGLYQLAVDHGAVADLEVVPDGAGAGGAELWHLRQETKGRLRSQRQEPQVPDEDGRTDVLRQLEDAVGHLRAESFPARPGSQCRYCSFTRMCPAQTTGSVLG
ncbi:DNA helicase [Marmoricola endophyticus]|uniref:DNA 3'-5' helicase n=1 Tax=Marmoricola endophyticus TaxID=2040280 RepID=A0A917BGD4_9ACTN|nr:ATP-dependent DNA helicase [Marmoricola endophyticus]GGF41626.1 DNA helicase [Marmoricola endophyticus]